MSAGLRESPLTESGPNPDILFEGDGTSVRVVILDHALWADRRAIMDSIMRASASAGKVSRTYLALPKAVACLTDARLFQERGIGLFTYGQRNVEEALSARYFETASAAQHQLDKTITPRLENELRELHAEFSMLQQTVQHLREELASSKRLPVPEEPVQTFKLRDRPQVQVAEDLPTFFAGNPWIEVLSRRGREEAAIVS